MMAGIRTRRRPSPPRRFLLRIREGRHEAVIHVAGGRRGTVVTMGEGPADATLVLDVSTVLALASGRLPLSRAVETGAAGASGDLTALADFTQLQHIAIRENTDRRRWASTAASRMTLSVGWAAEKCSPDCPSTPCRNSLS